MFDSYKCRPIPESELGLALLFVSLDKYCNPSINAGLYNNNYCVNTKLVPPQHSIDNVLLTLFLTLTQVLLFGAALYFFIRFVIFVIVRCQNSNCIISRLSSVTVRAVFFSLPVVRTNGMVVKMNE